MPAPYIAVSSSRERAAARGELPAPEKIDERTWCLPLPIDFPNGSVRYTLCYVLEDADRGIHLIDPGADSEENLSLLTDFLAGIGHEPTSIRTCISTHLHADHVGMARTLQEAGAAVVLSDRDEVHLRTSAGFPEESVLDRWAVPLERRGGLRARNPQQDSLRQRVRVDIRLRGDGPIPVPVPGREIVAVATPGHTPGHICLVEEQSGLIFSGDHVLPIINPGIGFWSETGANPLDLYLESLRRTAGYDHLVVCPGHGYRFTGLAQRSAQIAAHHERRTSEVAQAMRDHPTDSVWETARRIAWTAGWSTLAGPRLTAALAQTEMHMNRVHAGSH